MSDFDLIRMFVSGDTPAFAAFYIRYKDKLYAYVLGMVGSPHTAEDIASAIWEKFIVNACKIHINPSAYLFTVARNTIADSFKSDFNHKTVDLEPAELEESAWQLANVGKEPDKQLENVLIELGKLPIEQRDALLMKYVAGFSIDEIAAYQKVGKESAKSRLRYGLKRMRKRMLVLYGEKP